VQANCTPDENGLDFVIVDPFDRGVLELAHPFKEELIQNAACSKIDILAR
jgi:hypothetical protein